MYPGSLALIQTAMGKCIIHAIGVCLYSIFKKLLECISVYSILCSMYHS